MHTFSRTLLLAGVLAFGTLTAACGDKVEIAGPAAGVQLVTVTPPNASIAVGESIVLSGQVTADAASAKTVTWSTSSAAIATVDANGKVVGVKAGSASITATSTADPTKAASSAITVTAGAQAVVPSIAINGVTQNGNAVNLANTAGQIDVTVNTSGGGLIEAFLSNCAAGIAASETAVASQTATSAQPGTVTLSFNTAQLTAASAPRFPNGNYCIKTRLTNGAQTFIATNTVPVTLNNANTFSATVAFANQNGTGAATSAVSSINGLNYNQGTLTVAIKPVIFSSSSPAALISGYITRNGEQNGAGVPVGPSTFTNAPVTAGVTTIVLADTAGAVAGSSIYQYTSLAAGDTLYIQSATDAAGNAVTLAGTVAVAAASGIRIDNDVPLNAATTYTVTAPNGYVGAAYKFSSGTGGTAAADTKGGIPGVGGITTTYWVGPATAAGFTNANDCSTTGLISGATGADFPNTTATNIDKAKVIVADALGNKVCKDVASTFTGGLFGIDKIAPSASLTTGVAAQTAATDAAANTGYNVSKNFTFVYSDTISGFDPSFPVSGTLTRNFFATGSDSVVNCVIGTYTAGKACTAVPMAGVVEITNASALPGYYTLTANSVDRAGNASGTVTRVVAFDAGLPTAAAPTLAASVVVTGATLGTASVSSALTDNFDLASSAGRLVYGTAATFAAVAGPSLGTTFDAAFVKSATATISLPNVYRGLQTTTAGAINAGAILPTATVTATDVGRNSATSTAVAITTTTASADVLTNSNTLNIAATSLAPATSQSSTVLTVTVGGLVSDAAFQSQPFQQIDLYKVVSGELVFVSSLTVTPSVTDVGTARTYTWVSPAVSLTAAATNTFVAIGRTAAGQGVLSGTVAIVNP